MYKSYSSTQYLFNSQATSFEKDKNTTILQLSILKIKNGDRVTQTRPTTHEPLYTSEITPRTTRTKHMTTIPK